MPIRLNLLREAQAAEEARRKDPVKRAILAGIVIVGCVLGWSSLLQVRAMRVNSEFSSVESRWQAIEPAYKAVVENRRQALEAEDRLASLQRLTTNRFLWGSTLNELQHLLTGTEGITIQRIHGDQTFTQQAEVKPKAGTTGGGKPATATEKIVLTIDARDASSQPGDQVTKLKASLATPLIPGQTNSSTTNVVALLNISAPQGEKDGKDGGTYVNFTLQSTYPERTR